MANTKKKKETSHKIVYKGLGTLKRKQEQERIKEEKRKNIMLFTLCYILPIVLNIIIGIKLHINSELHTSSGPEDLSNLGNVIGIVFLPGMTAVFLLFTSIIYAYVKNNNKLATTLLIIFMIIMLIFGVFILPTALIYIEELFTW